LFTPLVLINVDRDVSVCYKLNDYLNIQVHTGIGTGTWHGANGAYCLAYEFR